mgnify:CR=1 FL=1
MIGRRPVLLAAAACLLPGRLRAAEQVTAVLPLRHRTVAEVLPVLRPLVPAPGSLSGTGDRLVVRTTPENLAAIREVLTDLDQPRRRLRLSLRRQQGGGGAPRAAGQGTATGTEGGALGDGGTRVYGTTPRGDSSLLQQVQVLEGREARLHLGAEVPVGQRTLVLGHGGALARDAVAYRRIGSTLGVVPQLQGERVLLELRAEHARPGPAAGGSFDTGALATTVSVPLGEWSRLAVIREGADAGESGAVYSAGSRRGRSEVLEVKVELLP